MLLLFDKYQNVFIIGVLLLYIFNIVLIQSDPFSIILFVMFILFQFIRLRKNITRLSVLQIITIIVIFFATIALLVTIFVLLNHLNSIGLLAFPNWLMFVVQIALIVIFLLILTTGIHKLYLRFTQKNV